jgi:hypothetical protein
MYILYILYIFYIYHIHSYIIINIDIMFKYICIYIYINYFFLLNSLPQIKYLFTLIIIFGIKIDGSSCLESKITFHNNIRYWNWSNLIGRVI